MEGEAVRVRGFIRDLRDPGLLTVVVPLGVDGSAVGNLSSWDWDWSVSGMISLSYEFVRGSVVYRGRGAEFSVVVVGFGFGICSSDFLDVLGLSCIECVSSSFR